MSMGKEFGNPVLTPERLTGAYGDGVMTVKGTVVKYIILLAICLISGGWVMGSALQRFHSAGVDFSKVQVVSEKGEDGKSHSRTVYVEKDETGKEFRGELPKVDLGPVSTLMWIGLGVGFVLAMICIFSPTATPFLSPLYAVCEGFALGGLSAVCELQFAGIAMQALVCTITVQLVMLVLYSMGVLRATGGFVTGLLAVMLGILALYIVDIIVTVVCGTGISIVHSNGPLGIGLSIFVCIVAAFNFIIDYSVVDEGVDGRAPKYMEWYAAFGMLLTFVWLYLEILRLLVKLRSKKSLASFATLRRRKPMVVIPG